MDWNAGHTGIIAQVVCERAVIVPRLQGCIPTSHPTEYIGARPPAGSLQSSWVKCYPYLPYLVGLG